MFAATSGLATLYSLDLASGRLMYFDLFDWLQGGRRAVGRPQLSLTGLSSGPHVGRALIHERNVRKNQMVSRHSLLIIPTYKRPSLFLTL